MRSQGFIFSLDAFVAFLLTMITISLLVFTIGTPKAFYPSLEQAHTLAHDTLYALASTSDDPAHGTYLEQVLSGGGGVLDTGAIMRSVGGGEESLGKNGIIPPGFGFKLETYDFATSEWGDPIYDSFADPLSDRNGKAYSKLAASSTTFASFYDSPPAQGESPFCYVSCHGYISTTAEGSQYQPKCDVTPCSAIRSNFDVGKNSIRLVRLTVYA